MKSSVRMAGGGMSRNPPARLLYVWAKQEKKWSRLLSDIRIPGVAESGECRLDKGDWAMKISALAAGSALLIVVPIFAPSAQAAAAAAMQRQTTVPSFARLPPLTNPVLRSLAKMFPFGLGGMYGGGGGYGRRRPVRRRRHHADPGHRLRHRPHHSGGRRFPGERLPGGDQPDRGPPPRNRQFQALDGYLLRGPPAQSRGPDRRGAAKC